MRFFSILISTVFWCTLWGQQQNLQDNYVPLACDSTAWNEHLEQARNRYNSDLTAIKSKPKLYRTELTEMYAERYLGICERYTDNHFYTDTFVNNYFQRILSEILKGNPQLPTDVRLLVARYPWANASCHGEGTIIINLDLVSWMETESQIAFVLCHELAHYYEDHVNEGLEDYVASLKDPEFNKKLRQIYNSEYNTYEQAMALLKNFVYSDRKHSRLFESEADSIAIVLMRNTPYSELEALGALAQMDKVDDENYDTINWATKFSFQDYPFNPSWLQQESGLAGWGSTNVKDIGELDTDSMKTHPDCKHRIELLQWQVQSGPNKRIYVQREQDFETIKAYSQFERVRNTFFFKNYGKSLFLVMDLLHKYPDNAYLLGIAGVCLLEIYKAQEKHALGKYVASPGASEIYSYNQLLIIVNNLRLGEIGRIGFHFLNNHRSKAAKDEELIYSLMQFSKIEGNTELYLSLQNLYKKQYAEGKYISKL